MADKYKKNIYRLKVGGSKARITDYNFSVRHTEDFYIKVEPEDIETIEDKRYDKTLVKAGEWGKVKKGQKYFFDNLDENNYKDLDRYEWAKGFEFNTILGIRHFWKKVGPTSILIFSLSAFIVLLYEIITSIIGFEGHWSNWLLILTEIFLLFFSIVHLIISAKELIELRESHKVFVKYIEEYPVAIIHEKIRGGKENHLEKDEEYKTYIQFFTERNKFGVQKVYSKTFTKQGGESHNKTVNRGFKYHKALRTIDFNYVTQFKKGYRNIGHERVVGLARVRMSKLKGEYITVDSSNNEGKLEFIKE